MSEITGVAIIEDRTVELTFADGSSRIVDLTPFLWGPVFDTIARDDAVFARVTVDPEHGSLHWPDGAELGPNLLHGDYESTQPWKVIRH